MGLFNGVCDSTKVLQTLSGSMSATDVKWIFSSSERYMFVKLFPFYKGFSANIHYSKNFQNIKEYFQNHY